ncbi:ankyrin-1-like [Lineus longissimus]|uniref:ankyrin-1-like n=1 Tax=Lineus longissimus TaxID=88925 RepID=UPI00315C6A48
MVDQLLNSSLEQFEKEFLSNLLPIAYDNCDVTTVKLLLSFGADWYNGIDTYRRVWLDTKTNNPEIMKLFLDKETGQTFSKTRGKDALDIACSIGAIDTVRFLLRKGVSVSCDARTEEGNYPLFIACEFGHESLVKLLIRHGADVNQFDSRLRYCCPINVAVERESQRISQILLDKGADVNSFTRIDHHGLRAVVSPLMQACRKRNLPIVQLLLRHGADVNLKNHNNKTALHICTDDGSSQPTCRRECYSGYHSDGFDGVAKSANPEIVRILLEYGADPHSEDSFNTTPLERVLLKIERMMLLVAKRSGSMANPEFFVIASLLLKAGGYKEERPQKSRSTLRRSIKQFMLMTPDGHRQAFHNKTDSFVSLVKTGILCGMKPGVKAILENRKDTRDREKAQLELEGWLTDWWKNGLTLKNQCRLQLRRMVRFPLTSNVWSEDIQLPQPLRKFIVFEHF